jgi:hypothetical protein
MLEPIGHVGEVTERLEQRVHARVTEAQGCCALRADQDRLLQPLEARRHQRAGVVQQFRLQQASVDLRADRAQVLLLLLLLLLGGRP